MFKVQVQSKTVAVFCNLECWIWQQSSLHGSLQKLWSEITFYDAFFLNHLKWVMLSCVCFADCGCRHLDGELQLEPSLRREMWQLGVFISTNGLTGFICTKSVSVWVSLSDYWQILHLSMLPGKQRWWPCISIMLHSPRTSWESILSAEWSINFALRHN